MVFGDQETEILQDCPGPTLVPQLLLSEKAVPPTVMLSMVRVVLRLFVRIVASGGLHWQVPFKARPQAKVRLLGTSLTGPVPGAEHVRSPVPCNVTPIIPAADAVMVTGPPILTQVAAPVLGSIVTVLVSEEAQCAGKFVWVVGA
jgi:hypothetical protein